MQRKEIRQEDSFYSKQGKMESKVLYLSNIQQTSVDTHYIINQKNLERNKSDIIVHFKALCLVFPKGYLQGQCFY